MEDRKQSPSSPSKRPRTESSPSEKANDPTSATLTDNSTGPSSCAPIHSGRPSNPHEDQAHLPYAFLPGKQPSLADQLYPTAAHAGEQPEELSSAAEADIQQEPADVVPTPSDVLFGRGMKRRYQAGNNRMLQMATLFREDYSKASRVGKNELSRDIVQLMKSGPHRGRFLKLENGRWEEVSDEAARLKVGHAIRDGYGPREPDPGAIEEVSRFKEQQRESRHLTEAEFQELESDARFLMQVYNSNSSSSSSSASAAGDHHVYES